MAKIKNFKTFGFVIFIKCVPSGFFFSVLFDFSSFLLYLKKRNVTHRLVVFVILILLFTLSHVSCYSPVLMWNSSCALPPTQRRRLKILMLIIDFYPVLAE